MKSNQDDYLKYWKVIRQFTKIKYEVSQADLDMLMFLYSEKYFDKYKFEEYEKIFSWDRLRFDSLKRRGWIELFRSGEKKRSLKRTKPIYQLTNKAISMIESIYRKLSGEEIPVSPSNNNKIFAKNVSYLDNVYKDMILKMNTVIKEKRNERYL